MIISSIFGYFAIFTNIITFTTTNKIRFLIFNALSTILYGISIGLIEGYTGCYISIISVILSLYIYFDKNITFEQTKMLYLLLIIVAFILGVMLYKTENIRSLLPFLGQIFSFISIITSQNNLKLSKIIMLGSAITWLFYGILLNSITAILFDVIGIISLIIGIYRLKKQKELI